MAEAPGHRLGQIIGETLEASIEPVLKGLAKEHGLYLDSAGHRPARQGKKVTWVDDRGNRHDLDFVLERGGTDEKLGTPAAFIEIAWRRYTKHSKAKAQEIQGAIEPLFARFSKLSVCSSADESRETAHATAGQPSNVSLHPRRATRRDAGSHKGVAGAG